MATSRYDQNQNTIGSSLSTTENWTYESTSGPVSGRSYTNSEGQTVIMLPGGGRAVMDMETGIGNIPGIGQVTFTPGLTGADRAQTIAAFASMSLEARGLNGTSYASTARAGLPTGTQNNMAGQPGSTTGPRSTGDAALDAANARLRRDIYSSIESLLKQYEIEDPNLMGLVQQLLEDDASEAEIQLKIRDSQAWKTRFAGNEARKQRGFAPLDPQTYIAWEQEARQLMREANLPAGFFDTKEDFVEMIGKDVSIRELNRRISNGFVKVSQAPAEIRAAFADYFGANGDAALAALFLNYEKGADVLEKHVAAAEFGGTARRFGFRDDQVIAQRAADLGISRDQAEQGMAQVIDINHLFNETVSEAEDFTAEREGFGSVFGFTPQDADRIRRRRETRTASMSGSTAGAMISREGVLGFRTASTSE